MVLLSGIGGETAFLHDSNLLIFTSAHVLSHATRRRITANEALRFPNERFSSHLERRKPARPEWEASSISGVTIRSIMSVSTVKVGTTMKSMNPETKSRIVEFIHHLVGLRNRMAEQNPEYL